MINESELKEKFVRMCSLIETNQEGEYIFFFDDVEYRDYELSLYPHYKILREKMKNLIPLVNENPSILDKDIEEDIWYLI